jgi:ATP-dependent DNA helicase RecG
VEYFVNEQELRALIAGGETLTVEFKSDLDRLPDVDFIEAVVCLANYQGGHLLLGVEDNGRVTGLHQKHRTSPANIAAFVASQTVPPLDVAVACVPLAEGPVCVVTAQAAHQPVATGDGKAPIRFLTPPGKPGCRPLYPYELVGWRADRGLADLTAMPVTGATWTDLDPVEFARLRRMVEENRGDASLLGLSDLETAQALGLVLSEGEKTIPTLAGLLLMGKEAVLRKHLPAHEVAFQVLHSGQDVAVNEWHRWPLLRTHEWLTQALAVRNEEQEMMVDGIRVGVPHYDRNGAREAINNALIHRDYGLLGAVHVQVHDDHLFISNPGGFVIGVNANNILAAAPRARNLLLADAFKRAGLVERTGRGVDTIYRGQVQNGRPSPDYAVSTEVAVTVILDTKPADLDFVLLSIYSNRRAGRSLQVDELLALWEVWQKGQVDAPSLAPVLQRQVAHAASVLDGLQQAGILQAAGNAYRIAIPLLKDAGQPVPPVMAILAHVQEHGRITRREAMIITGMTEDQASKELHKIAQRGDLEQVGKGRSTHYRTHPR